MVYKGHEEGAFGHKCGVRQYDAESGRFTSPDPFKGYISDPASQNPYMYCRGNPIKYADPSGYDSDQGGQIVVHVYLIDKTPDFNDEAKTFAESRGYKLEYKEPTSGNIDNSLREADYFIVRSHGGINYTDNFVGFEQKGVTYINLAQFTKALKGDRPVKTKIIFADACYSANVKDEKFINAIKDKNVLYIGDTSKHMASDDTLKFIMLCSRRPERMEYYLKTLNQGPPKREFIILPKAQNK